MRAAVLNAVHTPLKIEELQEPSPRAGEVLIDVAGCGVCHTDLHVVKDEVAFPMPCVLGHEISGTVLEVGEGVTNVAPGDRVASSFMMPCGTCRHCVRGHDDLCESFFAFNRLKGVLYDGETRLRRADGTPVWMYSMAGLAERCVVPATDVFPLPGSLDLVSAAVLGCSVFTALGAVRNVADLKVGETVAVLAVGGVGTNIIQLAKVFGASRIIAVDLVAEKLDLARDLGATDTIDASGGDAAERIRELTSGRGVDVAFEALGHPTTVDAAIRSVDDGGRAVLVGIAPKRVTASFDITHVVRRKIRILGSYGARARTDMPMVIQLAAEGKIDLERLITRRVPLTDASDTYDALARGEIVGRAVVDLASSD
jgi:succinate semialdehyde reductase (NADPH)